MSHNRKGGWKEMANKISEKRDINFKQKDLSNEIHMHKLSYAHWIILGAKESFPNAKNASCFLKDKWFNVDSGDILDIAPNTKHGFTIKPLGALYFLSVQTPPIESKEGHDDYYRVTIT